MNHLGRPMSNKGLSKVDDDDDDDDEKGSWRRVESIGI